MVMLPIDYLYKKSKLETNPSPKPHYTDTLNNLYRHIGFRLLWQILLFKRVPKLFALHKG